MVHYGASASVPTWFAVLAAASLLAGCVIRPAAEAPPESEPAFVEVARTYRENFSSFPTTAALVQETANGCLYSVAEGQGAAAVLLPDGKHAGCRPTEATTQAISPNAQDGRGGG